MSQLDIEMAFAGGKQVRWLVKDVIDACIGVLKSCYAPTLIKGNWQPVYTRHLKGLEKQLKTSTAEESQARPQPAGYPRSLTFPFMTYHRAMKSFGTDKPDLRIQPEHCSLVSASQPPRCVWSARLMINAMTDSLRGPPPVR